MRKVKIEIRGKIISDPILENRIVWFPKKPKIQNLTKKIKISKNWG
jgi:hypothetical protein